MDLGYRRAGLRTSGAGGNRGSGLVEACQELGVAGFGRGGGRCAHGGRYGGIVHAQAYGGRGSQPAAGILLVDEAQLVALQDGDGNLGGSEALVDIGLVDEAGDADPFAYPMRTGFVTDVFEAFGPEGDLEGFPRP